MTRLAILLRSALLILTLVCVSQTMARSQKYKVTIKAKEQRLLDVFKTIQKQTNLIVFYSNTILNDQEKVSIQVKDEALEKVLDQIVAGKALQYEVQEKYIVISPKEIKKQPTKEEGVASAEDVPAPPPTIDVSGRITDEDGNPLLGASIMIKGTKTGTQTNAEGFFTLKGVDEKAILEVSYVGFVKRELSAAGLKATRTLALKRKESPLDEVQIIAYGTTTKRLSTGNIFSMKGADIEKQPVQNPLLALQGRMPGVEITQTSGIANSYVKVRIQGQNSISDGRNEPLIVIDGVPYPSILPDDRMNPPFAPAGVNSGASPLSFINPADIESMDVLKDADATAIYGSRGANGAILITTKKGKVGKTKIDLRLIQGWGNVTRRLPLLNTRQYLDMRYEALRNDNLPINSASNIDLVLWDTTRYTDWQKTLIGETAQNTTLNASIAGGTSAVQYLIGSSYSRVTDVYPGEMANESGSLHFNIGAASANQKFKLQFSGTYLANKNGLPAVDLTGAALGLEPVAPALYNADGTLNWAPNSAGSSTWDNPLRYTAYRNIRYLTNNLLGNAILSYELLSGLNIKSSFGYNRLIGTGYRATPLGYFTPQEQSIATRESMRTSNDNTNWIIEPQMTYQVKSKGLKIEALLGSTFQKNLVENAGYTGSGYPSDLLMESFQTSVSLLGSTNASEYRYSSLFSRLNFNYVNKYIVNFNFRRDASSRFGDANKVHNFSSFAGAWIFSEEKLIKNKLPALSLGKLRASYGITGSDAIGDYAYLSTYTNIAANIPYQNVVGLYSSGIANPHLQWEEVKKLSIGLDFGWFSDRLLLGVSYNRNTCSNQLQTIQLPTITGTSSMPINFPATVLNTSWEFTLTSNNLKQKNLTWTSSLNLTLPRNKLVSFPNIENTSFASGNNGVIIGQPLGVSKVFRYYGLDPATGIALVYDSKGNPTATPSGSTDRTVLISDISNFYGGLNNSITYKGFQLDFLFQFVRRLGIMDSYYFNQISPPGRFQTGKSNQTIYVLDRWQKPGDLSERVGFTTNTAIVSRAYGSDASYNYKASFIRLKNVSLSWQLPAPLLKRSGLQSASLQFQAQNLLTISGYTGLDPESGSSGLPPLRMITMGIKLGF